MKRVTIISKWIAVLAVLFFFLLFVNHRYERQTTFLRSVYIDNIKDNFINKDIVVDYIEEKFMTLDSLLITDFNKDALEYILNKHTVIKKAEVFTHQNGDIFIDIKQRNAIVRLKNNISDCYIDDAGIPMELSNHYTADLPVATGNILEEDYVLLLNFIRDINKSDFWKSQITQIHFVSEDVQLVPRVGNHVITFSKFDNDIKSKLDDLFEFYKLVMPVKGWQKYKEINLKYKNQIVCINK